MSTQHIDMAGDFVRSFGSIVLDHPQVDIVLHVMSAIDGGNPHFIGLGTLKDFIAPSVEDAHFESLGIVRHGVKHIVDSVVVWGDCIGDIQGQKELIPSAPSYSLRAFVI